MSKIAGLGGFLTVNSSANGYTELIRVDNMSYSYETEVNIKDTTDSTSGGEEQGLACTYRVNSIELRATDNTVDLVVLAGLEEFDTVDMWLKQGELDSFDYIGGAIVQSNRFENDSLSPRMWTCRLSYGALIRNYTAPTGGLVTPPGY